VKKKKAMQMIAKEQFSFLIFFLYFSLLSCVSGQAQDPNEFLRREHSLAKPYDSNNWDYVGSTVVSHKFVRLTSDDQSLKGALWNRIPVDYLDWEIQFEFKVSGRGKDLFGDGLAMFYAKDRNELGIDYSINDTT
jgi:lectin, mannose-binding 2